MCYVSSQRRMKLCLTPPPKGHGVFPASPIHWWLCWRLKSFHGMVANWHCMKMSIFAPKQASVDTTIEKFSDLLLTAHCVGPSNAAGANVLPHLYGCVWQYFPCSVAEQCLVLAGRHGPLSPVPALHHHTFQPRRSPSTDWSFNHEMMVINMPSVSWYCSHLSVCV